MQDHEEPSDEENVEVSNIFLLILLTWQKKRSTQQVNWVLFDMINPLLFQ